MGVKTEFKCSTSCYGAGADVVIRTSDGQSILAHCSILASTSPVLERKIDKARRGWNSVCTIRIPGAPSDAVIAFVQLLYSTRITALATAEMEDILDKHGMQLLALSHAYQIGWLKKKCEITVATELTPDRVIDVLKVAKLCNAPRLYQQCMKLIAKEFAEVQRSDGWQFLRQYDPALELEILQIIKDTNQRKIRWKQQRAAQEAYLRLNEAMDCLQHIFTEGCTEIGPRSGNLSKRNNDPCAWFGTCQGLQLLLRHFTMCSKKLAPEGCLRCQRMWQLLHLHASICDRPDSCKVPLCNDGRFKMKTQREGRSDKTWRLLLKRVVVARAMSALASRKMPAIVFRSWTHGQSIE
ncbi:BTB/POZ and TAZ domain-containing protein 2-like isoform X1 [Carex littledalei]|uniref:BTB/POZ and TAZ domain-containing protein 2-like isoform X1 n=1 Tax=Carex littledalei TaxID=544730 RepID=A0A833RPN2_9POAL|nr:BTB/POZ and TAZ domain-containing protein 2-like isoform X1 [Carex littledalei]